MKELAMKHNLIVTANVFKHARDTYAFDTLLIPWNDFAEYLTAGHDVRSSKDGEMFNGCVFDDIEQLGRPHKCAENVVGYTMVVLDYDGAAKLDDVRRQFANIEHVGYTSYRHHHEDKQYVDAFRIVIPLARQVSKDEVTKRRSRVLLEWAKGVDPSSFAHSRSFYLPAAAPDHVHSTEAWHNEGELFDLLSLPVDPVRDRPLIESEPTPLDMQRIADELRHIKLTYDEWIRAALAMCSVGYSYADFLYATNEPDTTSVQQMWKHTQQNVTRGERRSIGLLINLIKSHSSKGSNHDSIWHRLSADHVDLSDNKNNKGKHHALTRNQSPLAE